MTDTTKTTRDYLARLESELSDLPPEVRADIVAGIREELTGLDAAGSAARIEALGDPAFIAAEARAATATAVGATPAPVPGRIFSIVAVIVLIAGSFVVPVLGALVGLVWVSFAKAWSRREKLVMWLVPIVAIAIGLVVGLITSAVDAAQAAQDAAATPAFTGPTALNRFNGWHVSILLGYFIVPIEGIVLAVRAHGRGWRPRT